MSKPLTLIALIALCFSAGIAQAQVTLTDTPGAAVAIPDGSRTGLSRTLAFAPTTDRIRSFRLDLRVTHGDDDNLDIFLIPPWATWTGPYTLVNTEFSAVGNIQNAPFPRGVIELTTDNQGGGNGDDFGSGNPPGAVSYARFSAAGDPVNPATQAITAGGRPFTANVYIPEGVDAMEDVYGRNPSGTWTLVIADDNVGSTGTLVSWRISYTAEASGSLYAHLGPANDPGAPIARGQASQVLGQFRLDAVGVATTVTSITFRETAAVNLNTLLSAASLYRDVNSDGLFDGGDVLLATAAAAASPNITFAIGQAIAANSGVDLLLVGTVIAAPAPVSMQMEINLATSITSALTETGLFPRRAGPRPFVTNTTFTSRPNGSVLIVDNTDTGITNTLTIPATTDRINSLRIGVRMNHTYSADLDLYLLPPGVIWAPPYATPFNGPVLTAPPGAIELSTDNNASGDHFGANLTNYTYNYARFSGATDPTWPAAASVAGQAAPFTGAAQYRPEGLTAFNLLYAGNPSGTWTLIAVDAWENDVGYLMSWQIEYVPVTTAQLWVNAGELNNPGLAATTGTAGNVFGQLKVEAFNTAATVSQIIARETNGFTIGTNLSALSLYRDNNVDGLFDGGDTLLVAGTLAGAVATFNLAPVLSLPINTGARLLLVGTVLGTPANTVLTFQLTTNADVTSVPVEIAPYAVQLGPHPLNAPYTYVSTPTGGIPITDNTAAGITNTITIPATTNIIGALRIGVRIDHASDQDLDIWLIPPGVTWAGPYTTINNGANVAPPAGVIELSTDNGGTGDNYGSGSPSFIYTAFSRNGDRRFDTGASTIVGGTAAFVAASGYQPEDTVDFNVLYGGNPSGNWTIAIGDDNSGNQGRLISWYVQYVPAERAVITSTPTAGFTIYPDTRRGQSSAAQGFQISNVGEFNLTVTSVTLTGANPGDFSFVAAPATGLVTALGTLAPFNVIFTPTTTGLRTANISVTYTPSTAQLPSPVTITYAISGTGITPIIELRETDVAIGPLVTNGQAAVNGRAFASRDVAAGASTALTIFVKNTGTATMNLGLPTLGGANPGDFVLSTVGYTVTVLAGASTSFTVAFDPTTTGARAAIISFTHDATFTPTASPFTFALNGTGYLPVLTIVAAGTPSETGPATGTYTVTATPAPQVARTVNFTMSGVAQTAAGLDYDLATTLTYGGVSGTFTLGLSGTAVITLTPVNDTRVEATESAIFTLNAGANYTLGAPLAGTLNITDNDSATVTVTAAGTPAEGGGTATYTVTTASTLEVALTVNFTMSGLASTVTGTDYTLSGAAYAGPTGTVTLAIGVGSSTIVTLTVFNDALVEGPEDAVLTLNAGTQYVVGAPASATRSITDNDSTTITMVAAGAPNEAGVVTGTYTLTATPQPVYATSVNISLSGTAQFGAAFDYTVSGGGIVISTAPGGAGPWLGTVSIPGGVGASVNIIVTLTPIDDARVEATETATLAVAADTLLTDPAYLGTPSQARSLLDNDTATVTVTAAGLAAESPLVAGLYTITTTSTLEVALTINFTMTGTAAIAVGADYNLSGNASYVGGTGIGTATLPVGVAPSVIVTLTPVNDVRVEATEIATLTLNAGTQYAPGAPLAGSVTIADDDNATVSVSFAGSPAEAGSVTGTYTLATASTLEVAVIVNFTMSGVASTVSGADYSLSGATYAGPTGTATLPIGVAPSAVVTLTPVNDTRVESNESATLTLNAGTKYVPGAPNSGTLTITDDDAATISVTAAGAPAEGGGTGTYTITTAATLEVALTINFTMSGAASTSPGTDYTLNSTTFPGPTGTATLPIGVGPSVIVTLTVVNDSLVEGPEDAIFTLNAGTQYVIGAPASATRTITDNDNSVITMTQAGAPSETGPANGTYTITATPQPANPMSVNISLSGTAQFGAAFDYTVSGGGIVISTAPGGAGPWLGTVSIPGGAGASVNIIVTLTPIDDARVESTETAQLAVTADTLLTDPAYSGTPAQTHNIADNDVAIVTVTTTGTPTEAGSIAATYTLTTLNILDIAVTVTFSMSGTATVTPANDYGIASTGGSYAGPGGTAVLPAGSGSSVVITLTPVQDTRVEANETAILTVQSVGQAAPGVPGSDTLTITDDDVAVITVTPAGSPAESPLVAGTFTISTVSTLEIALTVNFSMSGVAVNADYALSGAASFAFPAGTATLTVGTGPRSVVVTLTPVNDVLVEGSETATLSVTAGVKYSGTPSANLTILDDDTATITVTASGTPVEGGASVSTFTLATTANLAVPIVVNFTMAGLASAVQGTDYTLAGFTTYPGPTGTATLPAGLASSVNVTFTVIDDAFVEGPEDVTLTINAGGYTIGAPGSNTLTIADNDTSSISIALAGTPTEAGAATGTYTLTATPAPVRNMLVNFAMTGTASFAVGGDYALSGATLSFSQITGLGSVTIGAGGSVVVTLTPVDDTRVEAAETAIMTVTADSVATDPAYTGTPSQSHTITDNDVASVSVTASGTAAEPGTAATYTIQSASTLETPVTVTFNMSGTALTSAGGDYNLASAGGSFTGPGGSAILPVGTNTNIVVTLTPVNDARVEITETAILTVQTAGQVTASAPTNATLNITDDDLASVSVTSSGIAAEPGTAATYTLQSASILDVAVTVTFSMSGAASTTPGTDYNLNSATFTGPTGTAILPAGTSTSVVVTLTPVNDLRVEATESATLTVVSAGQAVAGVPVAATLNITDDDVALVTVTAAGTAAEPATTGSYTISTGAILDVALTINFTMSGSASTTPGTDYNLNSTTFAGPTGTATLPIGSGSSVIVTLTPVNDTIIEAAEIATLTINAGSQYTPSAPLTDSVTITDDDSATLTVALAGSPAETGSTPGTYTVTTSATLAVALTVNFTMSGVAATGVGADYNLGGTASYVGGTGVGTFTLPAGVAPSTIITLTPVDDARVEINEGATFTLNAGAQYSLGVPFAGSLTILDNDTASIFVTAAGSPGETGPASGTYSVSTSSTLEVAITVNFTMSGVASTVSGTDYTLSGAAYAGPGGTCILPIGAGSSVIVTLSPIDDVAVEPTESAIFTLNAGTQYVVGAPASDSLNIFDNDGANVTVTSSGSPAEAGTVSGTFTISTSATLGAPVTVNFSMSGAASTVSGTDYTLSGASYVGPTGTVTLPAGVAPSVIVTLTPINDARVEGSEIATLTITAGVLYSPGVPVSANLSIADDDLATLTVSVTGAPTETGTVAGTYTVSTTATLDVPLTVNFTMTGSAAVAASADYDLTGNASYVSGTGVGTATLPVGVAPSVIVTLTPVDDPRIEATELAFLTLGAGSLYIVGIPASGILGIVDNDTATVTVTPVGAASETGPTSGAYSISTTDTLEISLTINFTMSGAAALAVGLDYTLTGNSGYNPGTGAGTATLPIGAGSIVVVTLLPTDDALVEPTENADLTLNAGLRYVAGAPAAGTLNIADNDLASVTVVAAGSPAEGGANATFSFSTGATLGAPVIVNFAMSGLADFGAGVDFTLSGVTSYNGALGTGTVTLAAGAAPSVIVTLSVNDDALVEGPEDAILSLTAGAQYTFGAPANRSIVDNDVATITVVAGGSPNEAGPVNGSYTITATPAPVRNMAVNFQMSGSASFTAGGDYTLTGATTFSNVTGAGSVTIGVAGFVVVNLLTIDDAAAEVTEVATLAITADSLATDPAYSGTPSDSLSILDNDLPIVSVIGGPLSFGGIEIGAASAPQSYSVSGQFLTADITVSPPAGFQVALGAGGPWFGALLLTQTGGSVASTNIFVRFAPSALGVSSSNVTNASTGATTQNIAVSGNGVGIVTSGGPLAFGSQLVGTTSAAQSYTVEAAGLTANLDINAPAEFEVALAPGGPYAASQSLVPSSGIVALTSVFVRYAPSALGAAGGNVSNASTGYVTRNIAVSGNGTGGGISIVGPASFGNQRVTTTSASQAYSVNNPGTAPLTVSGITLAGANPGDFALVGLPSFPAVVGIGGSLNFSATFTPTIAGVRSALIRVNADNGGLPFKDTDYAISGTGTAPVISATPVVETNFGNQRLNTSSSAVLYTVLNTGDAPLNLRSVTLVGANPGDFTLAGITSAIIAPAASVQFSVTFTPLAIGLRLAAVDIDTDSAGGPAQVTITNRTLRGNGTVPTISVTPAALTDFGNQRILTTSAAVVYTIQNTSTTDALNVRSVTLNATGNPADFALLGTLGGVIAPSGQFQFSVTFTPSLVGLRTAQIEVDSDAGGNLAFVAITTRNLQGNGTAPVLAISGTQSFGNGIVGTPSPTSPIVYTLDNNGQAPLSINSIVLAGANPGDFALSGLPSFPAIVPAGGPGITFSVTFTATATAARNALIRVSSDTGLTTGSFVATDYAIDGNGTAGVINVTGTQNFGSSVVTITSGTSPITYTVTNVAAGPTAGALTVNSVSLGGANPADFAISNLSVSLPTVLNPGQSFTFDASFTPLLLGLRNADVIINSNTGGLPLSNTNYAINGTGTPGLFAATPTFPTLIDTGGPVIVQVVISSVANTVADVVVEYTGGTQGGFASAVIARTNLGTVSGNVIQGLNVTPAGITLEIYWDAYASERHTTAANYRIRFTPQNLTYGQGTIGTSALFTLSRQAGFAQHVVPGDQLTGRYGHSMILDTANDRLIVFGGMADRVLANDVWSYDFSGYFRGWHQLKPAGTPPPVREFHTAIYDGPRNRMVAHGGYSGSGRLADLWQLSLTRGSETWTQLSPGGTLPAGRYCHNMVFDAARNRAVMFGGYNAINLNDVWSLSLTLGSETWSQIAPAGIAPSPRYGSQAVLDVPRDRMVIYGGDTGSGSANAQVFALSLAPASETWSQLTPAAPQGAPIGRFVAAHGYAGNRESMLVVGGYRAGYGYATDAWLLDLNGAETWVPLPDDLAANQGRSHGSAEFDASRGRMVMFGGLGYQGTARDTISYLDTSGTPAWSIPVAAVNVEEKPSERWGVSAVFDSRFMPNGRVVTFGGSNSTANFNDCWFIDPSAVSPIWQRLNPSGTRPPVRGFASSVYDASAGTERMILFGGQTPSGGVLNDVWILDLSMPGSESWSQVVVTGGPSTRYGAAAIWETTPGSKRLIIQGGYNNGVRLNDTWALSLSPTPTWTQLATTGTPPAPRVGHGATFDSASRRLVIAQGTTGGTQLNDVWALDLTTLAWSNISAVSGPIPAAREYAAFAANAAGTRLWMFGGLSGAAYVNDLWQMDIPAPGLPVTWTQINASGALPLGRRMASGALLPTGRFFLAFGFVGITPNSGAVDAWTVDPAAATPQWQRLEMPSDPRGMAHAAEAYDVANNRMLAFGGILEGVLDGRLWALDLASPVATWSEIVPATATRPDPRRGAKFVYDPNGGSPRLLMFGGRKGSLPATICDELWELSLTPGFETWNQLVLAGGPPALADVSLVYHAGSNAVLMFGGQLASGGHVNTTWRLSLGASPAWTLLTPSGAPASRYAHSAILDPLGNRMIIFGGFNGSTTGLAQIYAYNVALNSWAALPVGALVPAARYYHSAVYDPTPGLERMILLGGYSNRAQSDSWQLDLRVGFPTTFSVLPGTVARPQPRWGHSVVFDTASMRMVIAGGYVDGEIVATQDWGAEAETWFFGR